MSIFKCKMCGGTLGSAENSSVCTCEYCGTSQTLPKSNDEVTANLFNRANSLRMNNDFDKALEVYESIVQTNPEDSEAYWGMVLCKYGIEYVDDPATKAKIPTCHRTLLESVLTDVDYHSALNYADSESRVLYNKEAAEIDRLQRVILDIVRTEKPYDVFICYKETDEHGRRTQDSVIANDIYYQLTQEGFKVFYAAITLEDKLGQEYEPYIFAALQSAKVMLVIGTKADYFQSPWMKNEWSRYLKILKANRSKLLIPCYKDMNAYDLPMEFSHLQAQDMSRIGFVNDVIRGIKKVVFQNSGLSNDAAAASVPSRNEESPAISHHDKEKMLQRAEIFLNDSDFDNVLRYCERVLDDNPDCAEAYFLKFLAEHNCSDRKDVYSARIINSMTKRFIDGYGYNVSDEKLFRERMRYVIGNSMKNALHFSEGNLHDEFEHINEGLLSMVRDKVSALRFEKEEQEKAAFYYAEKQRQEEEERVRKIKDKQLIKKFVTIIAVILMIVAIVGISSDGGGFFAFLLMASIAGLVYAAS